MRRPDGSPGKGYGGILLIASEMGSMPSCFKQEPHASWAWRSWVWELPFRALYLHPVFLCHQGFPRASLRTWTSSQSWSQAEVHRLQQQPWLGPCFHAVPAAVLPSQKGPFVASQSKVRLAPGMHATVQSLMLFSSRTATRLYSYRHYWFLSLWGASGESIKPRVQAEPHRASKAVLACPGHSTSCSVSC